MLGCRSGNDGKNHGILFATQRGREESLRECRTMESTIKCLGEQSWCMTIRHRQQSPADSHATYRKCGFLCVKPERSPLNYMRHIFRFQGARNFYRPSMLSALPLRRSVISTPRTSATDSNEETVGLLVFHLVITPLPNPACCSSRWMEINCCSDSRLMLSKMLLFIGIPLFQGAWMFRRRCIYKFFRKNSECRLYIRLTKFRELSKVLVANRYRRSLL